MKADCNSKGKKKEKDGDKTKSNESANATTEGSEWAFTTTFAGHVLLGRVTKELRLMSTTLEPRLTCPRIATDSLPLRKSHPDELLQPNGPSSLLQVSEICPWQSQMESQ
jgi:hypothetical protein